MYIKKNQMKTKSILKSKTFWVNIIVGLLAFIDIIAPETLNVFELDLKTQHKIMAVLAIVVGGLNIVLRSITNTAVSVKKNKKTKYETK